MGAISWVKSRRVHHSPLRFRFNGRRYDEHQTRQMSLRSTEAKIRLLEELEGNPKHGYVLAKDLGVRGSTIYEHLSQLDEHGYIKSEKTGVGVYTRSRGRES